MGLQGECAQCSEFLLRIQYSQSLWGLKLPRASPTNTSQLCNVSAHCTSAGSLDVAVHVDLLV